MLMSSRLRVARAPSRAFYSNFVFLLSQVSHKKGKGGEKDEEKP